MKMRIIFSNLKFSYLNTDFDYEFKYINANQTLEQMTNRLASFCCLLLCIRSFYEVWVPFLRGGGAVGWGSNLMSSVNV